MSIPSALGARLQVLGYCTAAPRLTKLAALLHSAIDTFLTAWCEILTRKVAASDYVCLSHTTEVAALEEDRSTLMCLCW